MDDRLFSGGPTATADAAPERKRLRLRSLLLACLLLGGPLPAPAADGETPAPLRVGIYQNEPKLFQDDEGRARGFFPEIIQAVAAELDRPLEYVPCTWADCLEGLSRGELDLLPDVAWSAERAESIRFGHETALYSVSRFFSRPGEQPERLDALDGSRIAVVRDSIQHDRLRELAAERDRDVRLIPVPDMHRVLELVDAGGADFGVVNDFFGDSAMNGLDVVRTRFAIQPTALHLAWRPDMEPALITHFDAALARLKAQPDSVYYDAYRRWLDPPERDGIPGSFYALLAGLLATVGALAAAVFIYRRRARGNASALVMNRKQMATIAEEVGIGLWDWDAEHNELQWDASMRRLYGLDARAGHCTVPEWLQHVHPQDRERVERELQQAIRRERPLDTEFRIIRADGEVRRLKADGRYVDQPGRGEHMVGINLDMTEMRSLEEQLHQARKMESLGALTGGIAHDFNNLLMVITNNLELAETDDLPDRERKLLLQDARQASERGAELTRRLLTFSRRQVLDAHPTDLNEQIRRTASLLDRIIPETIRLEVSLTDAPLHARVDIGQLENALINLVINARDAMPDGGRLVLRSGSVDVEAQEPDHPEELEGGRYHLILVEDDGTGMPAHCRERAFDPFYTTKEIGHGTGLGLSMVYGFVRQSGGDVRIDSEPGRGTRIRLYFPAVEAPAAERPPVRPAETRRADGSYRILVVEDDPNVRRLVTKMLDSLHMEHCTAADGIGALRALDEEPRLDLVLSDVVMPSGMNGIELARNILDQRPRLPVILMSGYSGSPQSADARVPDRVIWLPKPFTRSELGAALHDAMSDPEVRRAGT